MEITKQANKSLAIVVDFLNNGGVIICPTDTIYGFLALAENKKAVEKIYKIKKRPKSKPLPIFVKDIKMAKSLAEISEKQEKTIKKYWPGKYTFVLRAGKRTIALRMPKYKYLNNLLKKINKPLVQTSVNISNKPALTKISDIMDQFGKLNVLAIDAGYLKKSKPSKIIDLTKEKIKILRK